MTTTYLCYNNYCQYCSPAVLSLLLLYRCCVALLPAQHHPLVALACLLHVLDASVSITRPPTPEQAKIHPRCTGGCRLAGSHPWCCCKPSHLWLHTKQFSAALLWNQEPQRSVLFALDRDQPSVCCRHHTHHCHVLASTQGVIYCGALHANHAQLLVHDYMPM